MAYVLITMFSTALSTVALVLALIAWQETRKIRWPRRRLDGVELQVEDLQQRYELLYGQQRRQHARLAAMARRDPIRVENEPQEPPEPPEDDPEPAGPLSRQPDETVAEWKRRTGVATVGMIRGR